jgi:uncharacterized cupin superfamily protein
MKSFNLFRGSTRSDEEWLIVVAGTPTVRTPDGDTVLEAADVVCFRVGPAGVHRISGTGSETVRVAVFANTHESESSDTPQRQDRRLGCHEDGLDHIIRRSPDLDYYDGEGEQPQGPAARARLGRRDCAASRAEQ